MVRAQGAGPRAHLLPGEGTLGFLDQSPLSLAVLLLLELPGSWLSTIALSVTCLSKPFYEAS